MLENCGLRNDLRSLMPLGNNQDFYVNTNFSPSINLPVSIYTRGWRETL